MKVMNIQTKAVVEATKNEDGTFAVEGKTVKAEEMGRYYTTKIPEEKSEQDGLLVVESTFDQSADIGELGMALSKCQGSFEAVKKNAKAHQYNYADLEAVLDASRAITAENELAITQLNLSKAVGDNLLVGVRTMLVHSSGQYIASDIYVPAVKSKSNTLVQMAGVNITYLRRYGVQSILGLATVDTDGK